MEMRIFDRQLKQLIEILESKTTKLDDLHRALKAIL